MRSSIARLPFYILFAGLLIPAQLRAQSEIDKTFARLRTDSAAWQSVLVYIVQQLSPDLVRAASNPSPQPWEFDLPSDDPQSTLLYTQLRTLLRARQFMPSDSVTHTLKIGPLKIANDTARVEVRFSESRRCPDATRATGFGWSTTVLVPRQTEHKLWGTAFSRITSVGDSVGC
ncbi:MAG TPA: hypothetical protein VJ840_14065 [Gemmatimonadaceae bacterium]|nr:hypothetical protein [Gemmatimonadaceae bacterium]